jgi:cell division protein FtsW
MEVSRPYGFDKGLFFASLVLIALGLVMVFSASGVPATQKYQQPWYYFVHQVIGSVMGFGLISVLLAIKKPFYQNTLFVFGLLGLSLGLLVFCFMMPTVANTNRWIVLFGIRFQPSELAKISLILFLAWYLDRRKDRVRELPSFFVPLGVIAVFVMLILREPDFGTAILVFGLCTLLLFVGGIPMKYFAGLGLLALPVFAYYVLTASYRLDRVLAFLSPEKNLQSLNFQVAQSKLAVGSGGLLGVSLGMSVQKLFLPCAHTDFIFAILGEELGFIGATATLALFAIFVWRGVVIAMKAPNVFSQLAATGLTLLIGTQALLNITVVLGLGPAKGVPLPLLSFGRSSLLMTLFAVGLLLHISRRREITKVAA